ncbi:MAG: glycosyltransferase [Rickettsiales bacterium]|nr:glycosyltransferase [Rickettsiales bacterium]|tara:strand:+ start:835 stop:1770 length:936 start_codon:yes stop_codon:yes gene_type:complete
MIPNSHTTDISIVLPCYKSHLFINELYQDLIKMLSGLAISYDIIFVDDGSPNNDWDIITTLAKQDNCVMGVQLSRNFGQHPAIFAGLSKANGTWVVVMDSDMQDDPHLIPALYHKALEGYDTVFARRANRKDSFFKITTSNLFFKFLNLVTDIPLLNQVGNYGIYHRNVINHILDMNDFKLNFSVMAQWVGFNKTAINTYRAKRIKGKSNYSVSQMCSLGLSTIVYFSNKPLTLIIQIGFLISCIAAFFVLYFILRKMVVGTAISGWTSLIVSIFFMGGIQISLIGVLGIYLGQIFYQTKERPNFIIKDTT